MGEIRDAWTEGLVGTTVAGRYRLDGMLGAGGMGAVFAATHMGVGRRVAVKVLAPRVGRDPKAAERFRQEAQLAASVARRGVVDVFDFDLDPEIGPFLVMEYLYGESLAERIGKHGALFAPDAVRIVSSLLATLTVIHAQGVLHRDLKPANVFLAVTPEGDEIVKILDFGLARVAEALRAGPMTAPGLALGTPAYMAPEQLLGEPLDARADIYGVGGILFASLTGRPPRMVGPEIGRIAEPPKLATLRPDVPERLAHTVDRALARDRTARYDSAAAMLEALTTSGIEVVRRVGGEPTVPTPIIVPHPGAHLDVVPSLPIADVPVRTFVDADRTIGARPSARDGSFDASPRASVPASGPGETAAAAVVRRVDDAPARPSAAAPAGLFDQWPSGENERLAASPASSPARAPSPSGAPSPSSTPSRASTPSPSSAPAVASPPRRTIWLLLGIVIGILVGVVSGVAVLFLVLEHGGRPPTAPAPTVAVPSAPPPSAPPPTVAAPPPDVPTPAPTAALSPLAPDPTPELTASLAEELGRANETARSGDHVVARSQYEGVARRANDQHVVPDTPSAIVAAEAMLALGDLLTRQLVPIPSSASAEGMRLGAAELDNQVRIADHAYVRIQEFDRDDLWQCGLLRRADVARRAAELMSSLPDLQEGDNEAREVVELRRRGFAMRRQAGEYVREAARVATHGRCAAEASERARRMSER